MISYNENENKYVQVNGKPIPKYLVREVKKDLFQGGQQEVTYEGDLVAICNLMLSCGSFGGHN
jgi:hypothetical protein